MNFARWMLRGMFGHRRPRTSGEITCPGLEQPITIRRDRWGIPYIEADTDHDAAFAIGFCQGQDRTFQLEMLARVSRGELAALVGERGIPVDRMSRRIGFQRSARAMLAVCSPEVQAHLHAFAAGVNAGAKLGSTRKPHELALLKGERLEWEAADVLAFTNLQSFMLPSNWDCELARLRIAVADGPEAVLALDPLPPEWLPSIREGLAAHAGTANAPVLEALTRDLQAISEFLPRGGGSNNWAIAGSRTTSGLPLLASDPHLAPSAPPPWYFAQVRTPEWAIAGATFAGSPVFPIAHNGHACWGITAALTDNSDFFLETLEGNQTREADGSLRPCEVLREVIRVKDGQDVIEEVLITPRGPILSPVLPGLPGALSLRAVWLDPLPLTGFFAAARARDFATFRQGFAEWPALPLNVVYADTQGTIGWQLAGQLPEREAGLGLVPTPATRPGAGWKEELVPFDQMPHFTNPEAGVIVTANNPITMNEPASPWLGVDYIDGYRAAIITDELTRRDKWDVVACQALQMNVRSLPWEELRELVLGLIPTEEDARLGFDLLRGWDGQVSIDSSAAAVFEIFTAEMIQRVARAKAPKSWEHAIGGPGPGPLNHSLFADRRVGHLVRLLRSRPEGWFAHGWGKEMMDALTATVRRLRQEAGPGPGYWGWGHLRTLTLKHPLFGQVKRLSKAFNLGPVPCPGDFNTVMQAGTFPRTPTAQTHNFPNMRAVFDTAAWKNSRFVLAGGQSGNPCSPHYDDQFPLWQKGEAIPIAWEPGEIILAAVASLRLVPGV